MSEGPKKQKEVLEKAPTLYAITAFKLAKGTAFAIIAMIIYTHSDNDLQAEYQNLLEWMHRWMRVNVEQRFWTDLAASVDNLTEAKMVHIAAGTLIYSLFALVEGIGLMFRIRWVGWLTIGESAFFIPLEVTHLIHKASWLVSAVLIVNIFIVSYLYCNRERLFRHHH
jgi:uncharacterized membrane protein (DUF2068 family)